VKDTTRVPAPVGELVPRLPSLSLNTTVFQDLLTEILGWLGGMDGASNENNTTEEKVFTDTGYNE
jgi:hypothetical protein